MLGTAILVTALLIMVLGIVGCVCVVCVEFVDRCMGL